MKMIKKRFGKRITTWMVFTLAIMMVFSLMGCAEVQDTVEEFAEATEAKIQNVHVLPGDLEIDGVPVGENSEILDAQHDIYGDHIFATSYEYKDQKEYDPDGIFKSPSAMHVWELCWDADVGEYYAVEAEELRDICLFTGASVFLKYDENFVYTPDYQTGIKFVATLDRDKRAALENGTYLTGSLSGYKMVEAGIIYDPTNSVYPLTKDSDGIVHYVYGNSAGDAFITSDRFGPDDFDVELNNIPFTTEELSRVYSVRPFITLQKESETITLYSAMSKRNIHYLANSILVDGGEETEVNYANYVIESVNNG